MIRLKRIAHVATALLGIALLLFILLVFYLGSSQDGARRVFKLAQMVVPGELNVTALEGRLAGPLLVTGLSYRQADGLTLLCDRMRFDWQPWSLLQAHLEIIETELSGTTVKLPESEADTKPSEPYQGISLPLKITISRFTSDDFQFTNRSDGEPLVIDSLDMVAKTKGERLEISALNFEGLSARVKLTGYIGLGESMPLSLNLDWQYTLPEGPLISGEGNIQGDAQKLHLIQHLAPPLSSVIDIELSEWFERPSWQASLILKEGRIAEFVEAFPAIVQGRVSAHGDLDRASFEGDLALKEPTLGELRSELQASYSGGKLNLTSLKLTDPGQLQIEGTGEYRLADSELSAQLHWQKLRWPLVGGEAQLLSERGALAVTGKPDNYNYNLDMAIAASDLPAAALKTAGTGDLTTLNLERLALTHGESRIDGQGVVQWRPQVNWQIHLDGDKFNPGLFHQDFPGELSFHLRSKGELTETPDAELLLSDLKGVLRDFPVEAKGQFSYQQGVAAIEGLSFHSGTNLIQVNGKVGDQLALDWSIVAPDMAGLWPELSGKLNANGVLRGDLSKPEVSLKLTAQDLNYQTNRIERIAGALDLSMQGEQPVHLSLDASGLMAGGRQWERLAFLIDGSLPKHTLNLNVKGATAPQFNLVAQAGLDEMSAWQGILQGLTAESPELGKWQLVKPAKYHLDKTDRYLEPVCLASDQSRICTQFEQSSEPGWRAALEITQFSLERLQAWLPNGTAIQGVAGFNADLRGSGTEPLLGKIDLTLPEAGLVFLYDEQSHEVDFSGSQLKVGIEQQGASALLEMPLHQLGGVHGRFTLPGLVLPDIDIERQRLEGEIRGRVENLALLTSLQPRLQNSRGKLAIEFDLGGVLAEPQVHGEARLSDGAIDVPELGIKLRDIALLVQAVALDKLKVTGEVGSGKGRISLQGTTVLDASAGFPSEYRVSGKEWRVVDVPEAEVHVSPDLVFKHNASRSELKGSIKVPYARLRPRELPQSAVSVSPDMVVKQEQGDEQGVPDTPLHAEVSLSLGKRVSFDGFGLRGKFTGNLLIIDEPGRPVIGRGRLGIDEGVYQAYGQDLQIERGYALFADSPVDNPGINVRAIREVGDVIAGLRVSGTVKNPKLDLFSTPSMAESDVLTYLLTGRAPGESSGQTVGLAAALKASGASNLASELGRRFGLEELRVDTGGNLEEASLVAGTYLSPRLYVQYINELSTSETKLRMRYDLTDRWQLEAETGRTQAGDFFYTFER
jgi:translocation and assembly module TamB